MAISLLYHNQSAKKKIQNNFSLMQIYLHMQIYYIYSQRQNNFTTKKNCRFTTRVTLYIYRFVYVSFCIFRTLYICRSVYFSVCTFPILYISHSIHFPFCIFLTLYISRSVYFSLYISRSVYFSLYTFPIPYTLYIFTHFLHQQQSLSL